LANGKIDAAANGATDGYSIRLPDKIEAAASGRLISVNVVARAAGRTQSRFAIAYSTNDMGNSGWRWQEAGAEWSIFKIEFEVPVMQKAHGDFVGILPDAQGRPGTEFCYISINTSAATEGSEFPRDLLDASWYADLYPDLKLPRDLPHEARCAGSIQHYLDFGSRERRDPNALLDSKWYAHRFRLSADVDPLVHYAQHEKYGQVSPNHFWEAARKRSIIAPPALSSMLINYPAHRRPTYITGLFGTGRFYLHNVILNSDLEIAYFFRRGGLYNYHGTVPYIFSGHATLMYDYERAGFTPPAFGRALLERAAAGLINVIFIYRHPLDSLLSNWIWWRRWAMTSGIAESYKSEEEFHRDLNDNFYEFSLFCGGSKDFTRIVEGTDAKPTFMSLLEFVHETELFLSSPNVHCFRFEDFKTDAVREFKRLVSILAPDLTPKSDNVPLPKSLANRYELAKENVSPFGAFMASLPRDVTKRINALGYSV